MSIVLYSKYVFSFHKYNLLLGTFECIVIVSKSNMPDRQKYGTCALSIDKSNVWICLLCIMISVISNIAGILSTSIKDID